jgi:hypothetical protein
MTPVGVSEFLFAVRLSGHESFDRLLDELAVNLLGQLGCPSPAVSEIVGQLKAAVVPRLGDGVELDVQFHAHPGSCDVVVLADEREVWRTTRRLP